MSNNLPFSVWLLNSLKFNYVRLPFFLIFRILQIFQAFHECSRQSCPLNWNYKCKAEIWRIWRILCWAIKGSGPCRAEVRHYPTIIYSNPAQARPKPLIGWPSPARPLPYSQGSRSDQGLTRAERKENPFFVLTTLQTINQM